MHALSKTHAALAAAVLGLAACAQTYQPIVDLASVDQSKYRQDLDECRQYAEQVDPPGEAVASAILGAVTGSFDSGISAGTAAAAGAAYGGTLGAAGGGVSGVSGQIDGIKNCPSCPAVSNTKGQTGSRPQCQPETGPALISMDHHHQQFGRYNVKRYSIRT